MDKSWLSHAIDVLKDVPVAVPAAGVVFYGIDVKTVASTTLLVFSAIWAVVRAVDIIATLYWKFKDRRKQ